MSNTIGWGKGASNNSIGWGNVGTNGFGSIYSRSNSGETDLAGVTSPSESFKQRVLDDLGTFEAQQCLDDLINQGLFDASNFVLTPNGYKTGKLYALKPENGDLDVTWVRNGNATRVNSNGLIVNEAANVPRLDYLSGSCPSILVEEQKTNLMQTSLSLSDFNLKNVTKSTSNFEFFDNNNFISFKDDNSNTIHEVTLSSNSTNISDGQFYSRSFFAKKSTQRYLAASISTGLSNINTAIFDFEQEEILFDSIGNFIFFKITDDIFLFSFGNNSSGNSNNRITFGFSPDGNPDNFQYTGTGNNELLICGVQYELGDLSSYIPTNGSAVTRPADAPQPITPPTGTTEIVEVFEDGTTNTITTIPATYTIPFGSFKYILFN